MSWQALNPINLTYSPKSAKWPALLTANVFNQLGQYTSSPSYRAYCYAELAISSLVPSNDINHQQYSFCLLVA